MKNPIKWFWTWKPPEHSTWIPYVLVIVCFALLGFVVIKKFISP